LENPLTFLVPTVISGVKSEVLMSILHPAEVARLQEAGFVALRIQRIPIGLAVNFDDAALYVAPAGPVPEEHLEWLGRVLLGLGTGLQRTAGNGPVVVITDHRSAPAFTPAVYEVFLSWCRQAKAEFKPKILRIVPKNAVRNFTLQTDMMQRKTRYDLIGSVHDLGTALERLRWIRRS